MDKEKRRKSLVISGLRVEEEDEAELKVKIKNFIAQHLKLEVSIKKAHKINNKTCVIKLEKFTDKLQILKEKKQLKYVQGPRIFINNDMTENEREIQNQIKKVADRERSRGPETRSYKKLKKRAGNEIRKETNLARKWDQDMTKRQQCMYINNKQDYDIIRKLGVWNIRSLTGKEDEMEMDINNKQDYDIRKLGVWNIRSLTGKEDEMVYEFNKTALDILVIPETKMKGTEEIDITDGHRLLYSGVPQMNRAAGGIACLVHRRLLQA
ncbi:hypothetical protein QE152_g4571 [Popillia japonica]|uniref:Endonuclease-reverse transcriptase n=1 Tax=Popillia japonica TaxID=7064 RepID=A0AAW1N223_POPJA